MHSVPDTSATANRTQTTITCTKCGKESTVPFAPTPGRPVYCRDCFSARPAPAAPRGSFRGRGGPGFRDVKPNAHAPVRMLSMGRKGHFVHDALAELNREDKMDENQRRAFVEMLFTRGARQTTKAAVEYLDEKAGDDTISTDERDRLIRIVERYSLRR